MTINTNFDKALELREEYAKLRLFPEKKNVFGWHAKLAKLGYTEKEFILDIKKNYLKTTDIVIKEVDSSNLMVEISTAIQDETNTLILMKPEKSVVYNGNAEFNEDYCKENNIKVFPLGYSGGTIVTTKNDLGIVFVLDKKGLLRYVVKKINDWISLNFSNSNIYVISKNHNDILVDGYKILGCAENKKGEMYASYYQVSFDVDLDLIGNICTKDMVKTPKGLSDFGNKTREDLIKEIKTWLQ